MKPCNIVKYYSDNKTIVINVAYPYEIDLERIKTPADLLAWVLHLSGKPWGTAGMVKYFADLVCDIKQFKISIIQ